LICLVAFRKVSLRGVGSSSREESTGTGPDREPALHKSIKFGSVDGRELRADAITPWSG